MLEEMVNFRDRSIFLLLLGAGALPFRAYNMYVQVSCWLVSLGQPQSHFELKLYYIMYMK